MTASARQRARRSAPVERGGPRSAISPSPGPRRAKAPASDLVPTRTPTEARWSSVEALAAVAARVLLGVVLGWFGYHELVAPGQWTGYVPVLASSSTLAQVLVLAHGWALVVLAVALVVGVAPRLAAAVAAVLLIEIVLALIASAGLSDLVLRDVGVLGLAVALVGARHDRLLLRR